MKNSGLESVPLSMFVHKLAPKELSMHVSIFFLRIGSERNGR